MVLIIGQRLIKSRNSIKQVEKWKRANNGNKNQTTRKISEKRNQRKISWKNIDEGNWSGIDTDEGSDQEYENLRYQDLLDFVENDMETALGKEFASVYGKIWGNEKLKERQKKVLKNILIPSKCTYIKTLFLNSEIYNK